MEAPLTIGQAVEYHGTSGPNGLYLVEAVVEIAGETRYNLRSVPAYIAGGSLRQGPRYRHNGVGPAQPIRLGQAGRSSLCKIVGMTADTIREVEC